MSSVSNTLLENRVLFPDGTLWVHAFYQDGKQVKERKVWHGNGQLLERELRRRTQILV